MTHPKSQLLVTSILLLLTASVGCNRTRKYPLQGEVIAKDAMTGEVTVKHGDIPGIHVCDDNALPRQRPIGYTGTSARRQSRCGSGRGQRSERLLAGGCSHHR